MIDTGKRYYIVDTRGQYCKLNEKDNLVIAKNSSDAQLFTIQEANNRISGGKKTKFYSIIEAEPELTVVETVELHPDDPLTDCLEPSFAIPTQYDDLHNDWEGVLLSLGYLCEHIDDYQNNLYQMLSNVDREINDIMHYLELNELRDEEMLLVSKWLQERRRHRREIKDEIDRTSYMKTFFVNDELGQQIHRSLSLIEKMKERQYTPRIITNLFDNTISERSA